MQLLALHLHQLQNSEKNYIKYIFFYFLYVALQKLMFKVSKPRFIYDNY